MRLSAAVSMVVGAVLVLWPYAFHHVNWYGVTMWDGIVAIAGGALRSGIPAWFYLMVLAPVISLLGGLLMFFQFRWLIWGSILFAVVSLVQFPFGTISGTITLIILGGIQIQK